MKSNQIDECKAEITFRATFENLSAEAAKRLCALCRRAHFAQPEIEAESLMLQIPMPDNQQHPAEPEA